MKNEDRKIIAVDFDGTIVKDEYPDIGEINEEVFWLLNWEVEKYNAYIILWTCRCGKELQQAVEFCKANDIPIDAVNQNAPWIVEKWPLEGRKIFAHQYIDDRNAGVV